MKYLVNVIVCLLVLNCAVSCLRSHPEVHVIAPQMSVGKVSDLTHRLVKRQTTITPQDIADCSTIISDYQCGTSGYAQQIANIALGCRNYAYARHVSNACARSENGDFCGSATVRFDFDQSQSVGGAATCSNAVRLGYCPSTCRSFLQLASSRLGCCINTYINATDSPLLSLYSVYVDYRLWNLCNVPLPVADCGNTLPLNLPQYAQDCTVQELFRRFANYECMTSVGQPFVDTVLQNSRCYFIARSLVDSCATDDRTNQYCAVTIASGSNGFSSGGSNPLLTSLTTNCYSSSSSFCSSSCRISVINIANAYGCCVNVFNNSGLQVPQLSYGVWKSCGVNSPGFCTGSSMLSGTVITNAFAWMIAISSMAIYTALKM